MFWFSVSKASTRQHGILSDYVTKHSEAKDHFGFSSLFPPFFSVMHQGTLSREGFVFQVNFFLQKKRGENGRKKIVLLSAKMSCPVVVVSNLSLLSFFHLSVNKLRITTA